ncbi:MAG: Respiratory-chain NADH dehydrogenase domain 51 kDa subunit [Gammaproteobacteria bacterium]|nr:Respiratory-chain NADH dehydrogenase domain 51 kDa subunit [Gammaproteobacteria bacterium]
MQTVHSQDNKSKIKGQFRGRRTDPDARREILELLADQPRQRDLLIEYLHLIQDKYHQIEARHIVALADELKLAMTEVFEVATFYHHFDVVKDQTQAPKLTIRVCNSVSCELFGASQLLKDTQKNYQGDIRVQVVPCVGRCQDAPVVVVGTNPIGKATSESIAKAVSSNQVTPAPLSYKDYHQYRQAGGYKLLKDCHAGKQSLADILKKLKDSKLRGLGGAGFPTGTKWEILQKQPKPRLLAVNIDEGEPGTFKDRHYLESDPHRFLEGALIAAWAIEAEAIYLYLRDEYAGCRAILTRELAVLQASAPVKLPAIHLRRGAGAYICGEESAMIESIEGKRGMPRLRPPYVAQVGLFGQPTLEHNMETLYWVRDILEQGADWFAGHGRHGRQGLRSYSVSGRVNKPGVHLAPAGITLRELIDEYCGGMPAGHTLYAYFPGGASGGILPASRADLPLDFDTLNQYGCFIGSAAIIVLSDHDKARDAALNAMRFFEDESCGQCTPCRVGTAKAVTLMEQPIWDQALLEELAQAMNDTSICGLGQAAPNPLRCAMKYFPEEF